MISEKDPDALESCLAIIRRNIKSSQTARSAKRREIIWSMRQTQLTADRVAKRNFPIDIKSIPIQQQFAGGSCCHHLGRGDQFGYLGMSLIMDGTEVSNVR